MDFAEIQRKVSMSAHTLPHVVCVEGNIGSGKSTLLTQLADAGFTVVEEPVQEIWGKYLPRLYEDPSRWGFCFQLEVIDWFRQLYEKKLKPIADKHGLDADLISECKDESSVDFDSDSDSIDTENIAPSSCDCSADLSLSTSSAPSPMTQLNRVSSDFIIVERSARSAFEIFSKNLLDNNLMSEWEYSLISRVYPLINWQPQHILYIRTPPETCIERISIRNRDGEDKIDRDLIHSIHNLHENVFAPNASQNDVVTDDNRQKCIADDNILQTSSRNNNNNNNVSSQSSADISKQHCQSECESELEKPSIAGHNPRVLYVDGSRNVNNVRTQAISKLMEIYQNLPTMHSGPNSPSK